MITLSFFTAFVLLISSGIVQQTNAIQIAGTLGQCLQEVKPRVCDPHNVLSEEDRNKLDAVLIKVEEGTKREGYPIKIKTKSCGQQGITMPVIQLKGSAEDMDTLQNQLLELLQEYTDAHPCMRIAFVLLNADDAKIENRRFWCAANWNVPVKPREIIELFQKEISLVVKGQYGPALNNICGKFLTLASSRLTVPFVEAPIVTANDNTRPLSEDGTAQKNTVEEQSEKKQPAELTQSAGPISEQ